MPEYLAPGVYVEETSFRSKSIEGVSTSTAGFVGPARWGPVSGQPELLTSQADFERIYGGLDDLVFEGTPQPNYLAHGVRAFFEEGGQRLYVSRVFKFDSSIPLENNYAFFNVNDSIKIQARFPGTAGRMRIFFTLRVGANVLSFSNDIPTITRLQEYTLLYIRRKVSITSDVARAAKLAYDRYKTGPAQDAAKIVFDAADMEAQETTSTIDSVRGKAKEASEAMKRVADEVIQVVNLAACPTPLSVAQAASAEAEKSPIDQANAVKVKIAALARDNASKFDATVDKVHTLVNYLKDVVNAVCIAAETAGNVPIPLKDSVVQAARDKANSYIGDDRAVADLVVQVAKSSADVPDILSAITTIKNAVDSLATAVDKTANPTPQWVADAAQDKINNSYTEKNDITVAKLIAKAAQDSVATAETDVMKITAPAQDAANAIKAAAEAVSNAAGQTWQAFGDEGGLFIATLDPKKTVPNWQLNGKKLTELGLPNDNKAVEILPLTILVEVRRPTMDAQGLTRLGSPELLGEYNFDSRSTTALTKTFTQSPELRIEALTTPFAISLDPVPNDDASIRTFAQKLLGNAFSGLNADRFSTEALQVFYTLDGGSGDGIRPNASAYAGDPDFQDISNDPLQMPQNGLLAFESVEDISIIAAPGYSAPGNDHNGIRNVLITHCEKMSYRVAVLDTPPNQLVTEALQFRNYRSSNYAALYYPWIVVAHPLRDERLLLPPSGFVAGIYARNDTEHGVSKAPANEVVRLAVDFEQRLNKAQQDVLNPEGVNCFRFFPGRGFLLWGARTISDDPEWKYISVRRYFAYLEHSIDRGTQWVVFENNSRPLWDNVRHTIEDFLLNEWKMGALMGDKPEQAYFVRCDLSTMTQNDLDNGRLVCLIGVSVVKPAEFVIFRIGQWTADRKF